MQPTAERTAGAAEYPPSGRPGRAVVADGPAAVIVDAP